MRSPAGRSEPQPPLARRAQVWDVEAKDGRPRLFVEWGRELDNFDPVTQIAHRSVCINVFDAAGAATEALEEVVPYRQFTVQELDLLAAGAGLRPVGFYGEMDASVDLYHEDAFRLVACFCFSQRKKAPK